MERSLAESSASAADLAATVVAACEAMLKEDVQANKVNQTTDKPSNSRTYNHALAFGVSY